MVRGFLVKHGILSTPQNARPMDEKYPEWDIGKLEEKQLLGSRSETQDFKPSR